jgi:hypothetical protein
VSNMQPLDCAPSSAHTGWELTMLLLLLLFGL